MLLHVQCITEHENNSLHNVRYCTYILFYLHVFLCEAEARRNSNVFLKLDHGYRSTCWCWKKTYVSVSGWGNYWAMYAYWASNNVVLPGRWFRVTESTNNWSRHKKNASDESELMASIYEAVWRHHCDLAISVHAKLRDVAMRTCHTIIVVART